MESLSVLFSSSGSRGTTQENLASRHSIYCKKHSVRQDSQDTPNNRTLFTLGWPPYCKAGAIEELFSRAGHVTSVFLQSSPGPVAVGPSKTTPTSGHGFKVGYLVFASEGEVDAALRLCHAPTPIPCPTRSPVGMRKWAREYLLARPSVGVLERAAEEGVALYDRQREEGEKLRVKAGQPDEDGWITITRKTPRVTSEEQSRRQKKKKRKQQPGLSVYPWQQRESQREQVAELRRRFEEDKQRVAQMRENRRFKPY